MMVIVTLWPLSVFEDLKFTSVGDAIFDTASSHLTGLDYADLWNRSSWVRWFELRGSESVNLKFEYSSSLE